MVLRVLYPDLDELEDLSRNVGGIVTGTYSFDATSQAEAEKVAIQIATGQTLGYLPDNPDTYKDYLGRVTKISTSHGRAHADVAFPARLFGNDMAGLLTILFGKISFYPNLKLETVTADRQFIDRLPRARFGLPGIRRLVGKANTKKPPLMAILKPGLGPSDRPLAEHFASLIDAGTDLVKDDETRIDLTVDDALRRLESVLTLSKGRGLYVTHLSGPAFRLPEQAKRLQSNGAQAFLFCPYTYGLSALQALCEDPEIRLPIFAHPAFTGPMTSGTSSISARVVLGTILRWAGCDAVLYPSPYGSIALQKDEAKALHEALTHPSHDLLTVASVPSAGIIPEFVSAIREDFGHDVIVNAGTGMARSGRTVADGVRAFKEQIDRHFG